MVKFKYSAEEILAKKNAVEQALEIAKINAQPLIEASVEKELDELRTQLYEKHKAVVLSDIESQFKPTLDIYDDLLTVYEEELQETII